MLPYKDMNIQTLKGFRDFLPFEARKRQYVISTLKQVFESYGFEPLETPALEYEEILLGKYGEEGDKLMYRFEDNGQRRVALRYDQTVPLARVVAQYGNTLPTPFKRYQVQPVWRAENTQKGRFREFLQCDIDTVGLDSLYADAEIVAVCVTALKSLGFEKFKVLINDRAIFSDVSADVIRIIDKLKKIGEQKVLEELEATGLSSESAKQTFDKIASSKLTPGLETIFEALEKLGVDKNMYEFSPTLARGLDYYTGMIIEIEVEGYSAGSVLGGGRYDNLVGMFSPNKVPAVGCAFGFDRILEAMEQFELFPKDLTTTRVLVTIFSEDLAEFSIDLANKLRESGVNCELWLDKSAKLEKQLKYADQKGIPYVTIIGPNESQKGEVTLKRLSDKSQEVLSLDELVNKLSS
jgi:histidyl-tRNA synthetase